MNFALARIGLFIFVAGLSLPLGGCGFHAVYGTTDSDGALVSDQLNAVAIDAIPEQSGQQLRNDLIDRMYGQGRPAQPQYRLTVKLSTNEEDIGLLSNATSTLAKVDSYAQFTLFDAEKKPILDGSAHSSSSFDRLDNQYSTLAAFHNSVLRTVNELSEQIVNRLSLYFAERPAIDAGRAARQATAKTEAKRIADEKLAEEKAEGDKALARKAAREKAAADHAAGIDSGNWQFGY